MPEYHNENTIRKVYNALKRSGLLHKEATNAMHEMQNQGILFRENQHSFLEDEDENRQIQQLASLDENEPH